MKGDQSAREGDESTVAFGSPLPADPKSAEVVVPGVRSFDDPPPSSPIVAADERLLASTPDVRPDAAFASFDFRIGIVVALVEADVRGPTWAARTVDHDRIERAADHPLVVGVRARERDREGHASAIDENVAFRA